MKYLLTLCIALLALTSCEENLDTSPESADWQQRNEVYFRQRLDEANAAIAAAQATYGQEWTKHCPWRVMRTYAITANAPATAEDSICIRILQSAPESEEQQPLYTDSVKVNYIGRLIPDIHSTDYTSRTTGYVFDHTGAKDDSLSVFSPELAAPAMLLVSNTVEGFTTALQHMRRGDLWRVYIPHQMGYGTGDYNTVRGGSTLVFDVQLKDIYLKGQSSVDQ